MVVYSAAVLFFLLIATSLVAEKARQYRRGETRYIVDGHTEFEDTCDRFDDQGSPCRNVEAAVVCNLLQF